MKRFLLTILFIAVNCVVDAKAENMENGLFMAKQGEIYSKTSAGFMAKILDDTRAQKLKGRDGKSEWPIYRATEEFGIGVIDRLNLWGALTYTYDEDANRHGLSQGRVGFIYRAADETQPLIFDIYGDFHLGGVFKMKAKLVNSPIDPNELSWNYDGYTNGRFGMFVGVRSGRRWGSWTVSSFAEALHSFGNDNNEITIDAVLPMNLQNHISRKFSVRLGDSTEINAGLKTSYEPNENWSFNGGFTYKYHSNNSVSDVNVKALDAIGRSGIDAIKTEFMGSLSDSWKEYMFSLSTGYQLTEATQIVSYLEYTVDWGNHNSQNTTDFKCEFGGRVNLKF